MVIDMNEAHVRTLEQVRQVLAGTQAMEFQASADDVGRYAWIESVLRRFEYRQLPRAGRGPWRCLSMWTAPWARCRARPRPAFCAASAMSLAMSDSPGWARSRWATCTTCATARATATSMCCRPRPGRARTPGSGCARRRRPKAAPASSASTACTRATWTVSKGCTTSTPWTASRSGRWWPACRRSPRRTCSALSRKCWRNNARQTGLSLRCQHPRHLRGADRRDRRVHRTLPKHACDCRFNFGVSCSAMRLVSALRAAAASLRVGLQARHGGVR
jgi:hypothetical protein